jgi:triosephosphate isomerase
MLLVLVYSRSTCRIASSWCPHSCKVHQSSVKRPFEVLVYAHSVDLHQSGVKRPSDVLVCARNVDLHQVGAHRGKAHYTKAA